MHSDVTKSGHNQYSNNLYNNKMFHLTQCLLLYEKRNKFLFCQQAFPKEANVLVTVAKINIFFKSVKAAKCFQSIFKMFPPFIFTKRASLLPTNHPMEIF